MSKLQQKNRSPASKQHHTTTPRPNENAMWKRIMLKRFLARLIRRTLEKRVLVYVDEMLELRM